MRDWPPYLPACTNCTSQTASHWSHCSSPENPNARCSSSCIHLFHSGSRHHPNDHWQRGCDHQTKGYIRERCPGLPACTSFTLVTALPLSLCNCPEAMEFLCILNLSTSGSATPISVSRRNTTYRLKMRRGIHLQIFLDAQASHYLQLHIGDGAHL